MHSRVDWSGTPEWAIRFAFLDDSISKAPKFYYYQWKADKRWRIDHQGWRPVGVNQSTVKFQTRLVKTLTSWPQAAHCVKTQLKCLILVCLHFSRFYTCALYQTWSKLKHWQMRLFWVIFKHCAKRRRLGIWKIWRWLSDGHWDAHCVLPSPFVLFLFPTSIFLLFFCKKKPLSHCCPLWMMIIAVKLMRTTTPF